MAVDKIYQTSILSLFGKKGLFLFFFFQEHCEMNVSEIFIHSISVDQYFYHHGAVYFT
jgi:hypothetical protein